MISHEETDEKKIRETRRTGAIFLAVFALLFLVAAVLAGLNISNMRKCETECVRVTATVTGIRTEHYYQQGTHKTRNRYYRIFTYEYGGGTFEARDGEGWKAYKEGQIGKQIEIYVDPNNPTEAQAASSADTFSLIFVMLFAFSVPCFIAGVCLLRAAAGSNSPKNRLLSVWLPLFLICVSAVFLFWIGIPNGGLGAVFTRVRGAVGCAAIAGMVLVCALFDAIAAVRKRKRNPNDG